MEDVWVNNILKRVPKGLKVNHDETIELLTDEMKEDYLLSVKKAIGMDEYSLLCVFLHSIISKYLCHR